MKACLWSLEVKDNVTLIPRGNLLHFLIVWTPASLTVVFEVSGDILASLWRVNKTVQKVIYSNINEELQLKKYIFIHLFRVHYLDLWIPKEVFSVSICRVSRIGEQCISANTRVGICQFYGCNSIALVLQYCINIYAHPYRYACMYARLCIINTQMHMCIHTHRNFTMDISIYIYMNIPICVNVCEHIHIHTYIFS